MSVVTGSSAFEKKLMNYVSYDPNILHIHAHAAHTADINQCSGLLIVQVVFGDNQVDN